MTIKDVENSTGLAKANIRFYEAEGLIAPRRGENGYRVYSPEDVRELERIRLLRSLDIPLDTIRRLQLGEKTLEQVLTAQLEVLRREKQELSHREELCRALRDTCASYAQLQPVDYREQVRQLPPGEVPQPKEDRNMVWSVNTQAPLRRWLARTLDWMLLGMVWEFILGVVLHINPQTRPAIVSTLLGIADLAVTLAAEPYLLRWFGTTPGKWILGLYVTGNDGSRMTVEAARKRTLSVLTWGMGWNIPVLSLVRQVQCLRRCWAVEEETLPWEEDSELYLKDEKKSRFVLCAVAMAAVFVLTVGIMMSTLLPRHTGPLTVAEFVENFNGLSDYYGLYPDSNLQEDGTFATEPRPDGAFVVVIGGPGESSETFTFRQTDGTVTAVTYTYHIVDQVAGFPVQPPVTDVRLAALSLGAGQNGLLSLFGDYDAISQLAGSLTMENGTAAAANVRLTWEVLYTGFDRANSQMLTDEDGKNELTYSCTVELVE